MMITRTLVLAAVLAVSVTALRFSHEDKLAAHIERLHSALRDCATCKPDIDKATVIQPVPGLRAAASVIADYGTCDVQATGYRWYIDWGDGVTETGNYTHLLPVHQEYTYLVGGTYTITASYCKEDNECCYSCSHVSDEVVVN